MASYPAVFVDENGETRMAGMLTFTDPANQPGTFNGGTITNPLIIDCSGQADNVQALRVKYPATFDFSVKAFQFEVVTQFDLLSFTTQGAVSTGGNNLSTAGGNLSTAGGQIRANDTSGTDGHTFIPPNAGNTVGLYGHAAAAQPTLTSGTATPEQIALALQSYGAAGGT